MPPLVHQVIREGEEECNGLPHSFSLSPAEAGSYSNTSDSYEATAPPTATRRRLRQSPGARAVSWLSISTGLGIRWLGSITVSGVR